MAPAPAVLADPPSREASGSRPGALVDALPSMAGRGPVEPGESPVLGGVKSAPSGRRKYGPVDRKATCGAPRGAHEEAHGLRCNSGDSAKRRPAPPSGGKAPPGADPSPRGARASDRKRLAAGLCPRGDHGAWPDESKSTARCAEPFSAYSRASGNPENDWRLRILCPGSPLSRGRAEFRTPRAMPPPFSGSHRAASPPAPRSRRSPDGSGLSAWRSAAPACPRARCWARRFAARARPRPGA